MPQQPVTMNSHQLLELLRPMLQQTLSEQASQGDGGDSLTEQLLAGLHKYLASYVQGSQDIHARGVPLPEVDEQLLPLQQQVESVMQSVANHRASVPAVISKALEQQLQAMRPPGCAATGTDDVDSPADQAAGPSAGGTAAEVAQAQQLQEALRAAVNKLPALRARLEEMDARLQRNLEAVDAAQAHNGEAPRTVERVLRSVAAGSQSRRPVAAEEEL